MAPFLSPATRGVLEALTALVAADDAGAASGPLDRLRAIRTLQAALDSDAAQQASVREALEAGLSWEQVADAAGLKAAAAKFRWQGTDAEIELRRRASRKRSARPSSVPRGLPGLSVAEAAERQGVTVQAIYQQVSRGILASESVQLPDGRRYKRVFPAGIAPRDA